MSSTEGALKQKGRPWRVWHTSHPGQTSNAIIRNAVASRLVWNCAANASAIGHGGLFLMRSAAGTNRKRGMRSDAAYWSASSSNPRASVTEPSISSALHSINRPRCSCQCPSSCASEKRRRAGLCAELTVSTPRSPFPTIRASHPVNGAKRTSKPQCQAMVSRSIPSAELMPSERSSDSGVFIFQSFDNSVQVMSKRLKLTQNG